MERVIVQFQVVSRETPASPERGAGSGHVDAAPQRAIALGESDGGDAVATDGSRRRQIADAREALLDELPPDEYRITRVYSTIPFIALEVSSETRSRLSHSERVVWLQEDRRALARA
ncbi:MAG TPA: hypothetical protein VFD92_21035 [Candidatus Binatia bacterium]|nr:hypothetical protein [Candidatus Binatia bacterium]